MGFNRKKYFQEKRILAFTALNTKNNEWEHAKVINFRYSKHKSKSGRLIEQWLPIYRIPDGYNNPFDSDVIMSPEGKRCQLCGTPIIRYGIIVHHVKKIFLVVGLECYELYETDSDKMLKLKLLTDIKKEYIEKMMNEEKQKISELLNKVIKEDRLNEIRGGDRWTREDYGAYCVIQRQQWLTWGKVKLANYISKNAVFLSKIGYEPIESMGNNSYIKYYRNLAKYKFDFQMKKWAEQGVNHFLEKIGKVVNPYYIRLHYDLRQFLENDKYNLSYHCSIIRKKIDKMGLDILDNILDQKFNFHSIMKYNHWKLVDIEKSIYRYMFANKSND